MKKSVFAIALVPALAFSAACRDKAARAELAEYRSQARIEAQNREVVERYFSLSDAGNFDAVGRLYEPTTMFYSPSASARPVSGAEDIEIGKLYAKAIPDLSHAIEEIVAKGDKVVARLVVKGTPREPIEGFPPPGKSFEISSIYIFTLKNGKITEGRGEVDLMGLMQQLGMEFKPKESARR